MDDHSCYRSISLLTGALLTNNAHRAADYAFFASNPERSDRLRAAHADEVDEEFSAEKTFVMAHRASSGQLHYRPLFLIDGEPEDTESDIRWLWHVWQAHDGGFASEYGCYQVYLLEKVFGTRAGDHRRATGGAQNVAGEIAR